MRQNERGMCAALAEARVSAVQKARLRAGLRAGAKVTQSVDSPEAQREGADMF